MLQYFKTDGSEGIDVNKTSASQECLLCHDWFFKNIGFKFEEDVCNGCHNSLTVGFPFKNIAILNAKGSTFTCILMGSSNNEALEKLNNSVTRDRGIL